MIVMDEDTCMVDVAKYFMGFLKDESCGKCFTCRKGTQRMHEILEDITEGRGTLDQLALLEELAVVVRDTSMCGLGQSAANPVLSTLRYFRHEYERHIVDKRCDAFVCKDLVGPPCQAACPVGTEAWRYVAHIARGEYEDAYRVIREANPFPSVCARACDHACEQRCRAGTSGGDPIAIRALKRFITDRIEPSAYKPMRHEWREGEPPKVAVVGAGPAGITTAHFLSLKGYRVTVFEAEPEPGGMLYCAIPDYRLPRDVIEKEIDSLLDDNITVVCNTSLGDDITVDGLFEDGFSAVLLALGAHKSRPLGLDNEDVPGVYPSIEFLKAFNLRGEQLAKGRVGVIGGGNSAIDAARTALRQRDVESVTILYRRTRAEMPAFEEEVEAAIEEGVTIETLVSPTEIKTTSGLFSHLECVRNRLGEPDSSGRRRPMPYRGERVCRRARHADRRDQRGLGRRQHHTGPLGRRRGDRLEYRQGRRQDLAHEPARGLCRRRRGHRTQHHHRRHRGRQEGGGHDRPLRQGRGAGAARQITDARRASRAGRGRPRGIA